MVNVGVVAGAVPVADLTYTPSRHTLSESSQGQEFSGNEFAPASFPSDRFVHSSFIPSTIVPDGTAPESFVQSPEVSPPLQEIPAEVVLVAPQPKVDPPLLGGTKYSTSRSFENLGATTCQPLENGRVLLFEIERFPVSDTGACELAIVVQDHLRSLKLTEPIPIIVHIRSVSREYFEKYSGNQLPEHDSYPCQLLDQALPMGSPFKVVSGDADFINGLKGKGYDSFIAESVDQAMLTERRTWREANTHGEEFNHLPTYRGMLEDMLHALESRRDQALGAARKFVVPAVTQVQSQQTGQNADVRAVYSAP